MLMPELMGSRGSCTNSIRRISHRVPVSGHGAYLSAVGAQFAPCLPTTCCGRANLGQADALSELVHTPKAECSHSSGSCRGDCLIQGYGRYP
jgi:hypothetical protein